ncbi:hypothetical protein CMI47_17665 [Candidatus Pacearchaeota archaeon]|nr:hypothetical protein [Candidatus Pacearchaeota archaeon]|tara:strand:- start:15890 stop:16720 length:831 start_codon:yes stop_codon:yes gene_type:complete
MVKKGILLVAILLVLVVPSVIAASQTFVTVKTLPEHKVSLFILDSLKKQQFSVLNVLTGMSDSDGEFIANFSLDKNKADFSVYVAKDNVKVFKEEFRNTYNTGGNLYFEVTEDRVSDTFEEIANEGNDTDGNSEESEVVENEEPEIEEASDEELVEEESTAGVTGFSVVDTVKGIPKVTYYVVGGVVLVLVILLVVFKLGVLRRDPAYKYKRMKDEGDDDDNDRKSFTERRLEKKLASAQGEIARLKREEENVGKIAEVEKRIEAEKEELRKLKSD